LNFKAKQTFPVMKSIPVSLSYTGINILDKYTTVTKISTTVSL